MMPDQVTVPIPRSMLQARLATLRGEYTAGRRLLAEAEARAATLREQLLRIGGAAQVLEELLEADGPAAAGADTNAAPIPTPAPACRAAARLRDAAQAD